MSDPSIRPGWYRRKVTMTMVLCTILACAGYGISRADLGGRTDSGDIVISAIIEHFGSDSGDIERNITIPLEEELTRCSGIADMRSISEFGKSRIDCKLKAGSTYNNLYLDIRDAVDRVRYTLPPSVQKPKILSGSSDRSPVFIVAFETASSNRGTQGLNELRTAVERDIKPRFEKIEGTGEIEIGGGADREVHIEVDSGKAAVYGLTIRDIAGRLSRSYLTKPAGTVRSRLTDTRITAVSRAESISDFGRSMLPGSGSLTLDTIARAREGFREQDSVSRIDSERKIVMYVRSNGNTNISVLSRKLRNELERIDSTLYSAEIILDSGRKMRSSLIGVIRALIAGMGVTVAVFLFFARSGRQIVVLLMYLPASLAVSAAALSFAGIGMDHYTLSGFALATGLIIDIAIVMSEHILRPGGAPSIRSIISPLVSSSVTTVIVLLPFFFLRTSLEGSFQIAAAVTSMIIAGLCMATLFIPGFVIPGNLSPAAPPEHQTAKKFPGRKSRTGNKPARKPVSGIGRRMRRGVYRLLLFSMRRKRFIFSSALLIVAAGVVSVGTMGKDFAGIWSQDILFGHVEFESGASLESVDRRLTLLARSVSSLPGVEQVETIARKGNGRISVGYNPEETPGEKLAAIITDSGRSLPGCCIHLPERAITGERPMEITLTGPDHERVRDLARGAAESLQAGDTVSRVILHFKDDPPCYVFRVDRRRAVSAGLFPSDIAGELRWGVYGPVSFKWIDNGKETDVRVMGERSLYSSREDLREATIVNGSGSAVSLSQIGTFHTESQPARLYRYNKQRAVYLTVYTVSRNIDESGSAVREILDRINLPPGYAFHMDKKITLLQERIRKLVLLLILVVILVFMVIASQFESFIRPFQIIAVIPPSLAFPLIGLRLTGESITIPVLIGLIMLSGIVVNNAILIIDCLSISNGGLSSGRSTASGSAVLRALRHRLRPLLLTSLTTILGAVPLFFVSGQGADFMKTLAFILITGITGAVISSFTLIPAVLTKKDRKTMYASRSDFTFSWRKN